MLSAGEETDNFVNLSYTVSIVNGKWDGPYYFHYGSYSEAPVLLMVVSLAEQHGWVLLQQLKTKISLRQGLAPTCLLSQALERRNVCFRDRLLLYGFGDGPDLGVAPPGFSISVSTDAISSDFYQTYTQADVNDGLENTFVKNTSNTKHTSDADTESVMVQSDSYAPGEGNGYWAIGTPIQMKAQVDDFNLSNDTSLYDAILLTASISGPSQ